MSENIGMIHRTFSNTKNYLKSKCKKVKGVITGNSTKLSKTHRSSSVSEEEGPIEIISVPEENETVQYYYATLLKDLPNEILKKILENVSFVDLLNFEQVNKRFREVILNYVWPKKRILSYETFIHSTKQYGIYTPNFFMKMMKAVLPRTNNNVQDLDLSSYHSLEIESEICSLLFMTPKLISLNLSNIELDKLDLLNIAQHCPLLEELSLNGSLKKEECEDGLKQILIKCSNIKFLNLANNLKLNGESFSHIPTQIKYLNIASCPALTSQAMNHLSIRAENLETIIMCTFSSSTTTFTDWINNFSKLKFLEISNINGIFMDFSSLKELEMLRLEFYNYVNPETFQTLKKCPKLKSLEISFLSCPKLNIFAILQHCKALKYLHIHGYNNFNLLEKSVQNCQLKYLSISNCENVSAKIIKSLLLECDSLTHLEFTFMRDLNFKAMEEALKQKRSQRQNILKLAVEVPPYELPHCEWCEVISTKIHGSHSRKFSDFTNVRIQYHKQKAGCR